MMYLLIFRLINLCLAGDVDALLDDVTGLDGIFSLPESIEELVE